MASGRLHNPEEVIRTLGLEAADGGRLSTAKLLLAAYSALGESCPSLLVGDWSIAAWHPTEQRLFLARDHHGTSSLWYWFHDRMGERALAFGPDAETLRALGATVRLDHDYLAKALVSARPRSPAATPYMDLHRLPPSHALRLTPGGMTIWRYWDPRDQSVQQGIELPQAAEAFLPVFRNAVESRANHTGRIAATLSGGLDSASVAVLAARALRDRGKRLWALTHAPSAAARCRIGAGRISDEGPIAAMVCQAVGNMEHQILSAGHTHPVEAVRRITNIQQGPFHAGGNAAWILELLRAAGDAQCKVLLTGQGGNGSISWHGRPSSRQSRPPYHPQYWRRLLKERFPDPWLRPFVRHRATKSILAGTAISAGLVEDQDLASKMADEWMDRKRADTLQSSRDARFDWLFHRAAAIGEVWARLGAAHGLEIRDPTLDPHVLDVLFSFPDHVFTDQNSGMQRMLIREAMKGLLPDEVRMATSRGQQSSDLVYRLRADPERIEDALAEIETGAASEYLSVPTLRKSWASVKSSDDAKTRHQADSILLRGLSAGFWINSL